MAFFFTETVVVCLSALFRTAVVIVAANLLR